MLYALAHFLRDKCPWLWDVVERFNSFIFSIRYGRKLKLLPEILERYQDEYRIELIERKHLDDLTKFFQEQPGEAFEYFRPHAFDRKTLGKLQKSKAFLSFVVQKDDTIVGYFFLRCYFLGKCFRGYMVDYRWRNKGISKLTAKVMTDVATMLEIPSYGTIAPENMASMKSQGAVNDIKIIEQLANGDYYVEYCPKAE